jgi:hypothetical protein
MSFSKTVALIKVDNFLHFLPLFHVFQLKNVELTTTKYLSVAVITPMDSLSAIRYSRQKQVVGMVDDHGSLVTLIFSKQIIKISGSIIVHLMVHSNQPKNNTSKHG